MPLRPLPETDVPVEVRNRPRLVGWGQQAWAGPEHALPPLYCRDAQGEFPEVAWNAEIDARLLDAEIDRHVAIVGTEDHIETRSFLWTVVN